MSVENGESFAEKVKGRSVFSELVNARLTAKKKLSAEINSHVAFFQSTDLTIVEEIKENDVLLILISRGVCGAISYC